MMIARLEVTFPPDVFLSLTPSDCIHPFHVKETDVYNSRVSVNSFLEVCSRYPVRMRELELHTIFYLVLFYPTVKHCTVVPQD